MRSAQRQLEVSLRTVYRDVEALGAAGVPVYTTRGQHGGISLLDGYRTRLTGLTARRADAVLLAGVPGAADAPPYLAAVAEAAWTRHRVDIRYERSNRAVVERTLDPLGLVLKDPHRAADLPAPPTPPRATRRKIHTAPPIFLHHPHHPAPHAGRSTPRRRSSCTTHTTPRHTQEDPHRPSASGTWWPGCGDSAPRTYRVSRVLAAATRADAFDRPPNFDLQAFWTGYQRDYTERIFLDVASVRLSTDGLRLLFLVGPAAAQRARQTFSVPDDDGWIEAQVPIDSITHGRHALLQLGADVEVLGPPELRAEMVAAVRALAAAYAEG